MNLYRKEGSPQRYRDAEKIMTKQVSQKLPPIHPGEILREDFMKPARLTATSAGGLPQTQPFGLGGTLRQRPRFWLNLQTAYDLEIIEEVALAQIEREVRVGV
jgi:antitoxin HigA-1